MKVEHFILAQNSSIDRDNNSLSVFQILEDLTIQSPQPQIPFPVQAIVVICREKFDEDFQGKLKFKVTSPSAKTLFEQTLDFKMLKDHRRSRIRLNFVILLEVSGEYRVDVSCEEESRIQAEFGFHLNLMRESQTSETLN